MQKVKAKYISNGKIHEGLLIETLMQLEQAIECNKIHELSRGSISDYISQNKSVYVNENGGWCPINGVWEIIKKL